MIKSGVCVGAYQGLAPLGHPPPPHPQPATLTAPGGGSESATYPVGDVHQAQNDKVVGGWRIELRGQRRAIGMNVWGPCGSILLMGGLRG